jgi:murein DD-endopeptidase MepM/ murein hydrolase activator NlpD
MPSAFEAGNYVALGLGSGRYAFYEHLKLGSICVRADQRVHIRQVTGALGFSGDTTAPHLHLHVADGANPLEAEGLPFVIGPLERLVKIAVHAVDVPTIVVMSPQNCPSLPCLRVQGCGSGRRSDLGIH